MNYNLSENKLIKICLVKLSEYLITFSLSQFFLAVRQSPTIIEIGEVKRELISFFGVICIDAKKRKMHAMQK